MRASLRLYCDKKGGFASYVIAGKFDLARDQLARIEKLRGSTDCEYYEDLANALDQAHAL